MPRSHARILTEIWDDEDFLACSGNAQRLYLMLLSQPEVGHSGLLSVTLRRWSGLASDTPKELLEQGIKELTAARFIVVDDDTEELLIRSMVRNDGVWKQPKILAVAITEASRMRSRRLREWFVAELERVDTSSLSVKTRDDVEALLQDLPRTLTQARENLHRQVPPHPPEDPPPHPRADAPKEGPAEGPVDPPSDDPHKSDEHAHSEPASPDAEAPPLVLLPPPEKAPKTKRRGTKRKADRTVHDDQADDLTKGFWERYSKTTAQSWIAIRQVVLGALKNDPEQRDNVARALDVLGKDGRPVTQNTLTFALKEVRERRGQQQTGTDGPFSFGPLDNVNSLWEGRR